jgi:MOSC domain-containing protein YiiM
MGEGRVEWIGLASARGAERVAVAEAELLTDRGVAGDWHAQAAPGGRRQVTLVQAEHLEAAAGELGRPVAPGQVLRNLMVRGVSLADLHGKRFRIGAALLEGTGDCLPCEHMAGRLGPGGLAAMQGRGGLTARVLAGGRVRLGDAVGVVKEPAAG